MSDETPSYSVGEWSRPVATVRVPSDGGSVYRFYTRVITAQGARGIDPSTLEFLQKMAREGKL